MKNKKKRKYVWCQNEPLNLNSHYFYPTRKGSRLYKESKIVKLQKFARCPECKKKFLCKHRECEDKGCWHTYIPAHKKWTKQ